MKTEDKKRFIQAMQSCVDYYQSTQPSLSIHKSTIDIYWNGLSEYSIDQVEWAMQSHMMRPAKGDWFPKLSSIISEIQGGEVTADDILAMAESKSCPLGIIAMIEITPWTLSSEPDQNKRRQAASRVLNNLESIRARSAKGEYSEYELVIMAKHKVSPANPLCLNGAKPSQEAISNMRATYESAISKPRYRAILGLPGGMDKLTIEHKPDAVEPSSDVRRDYAFLFDGRGFDLDKKVNK